MGRTVALVLLCLIGTACTHTTPDVEPGARPLALIESLPPSALKDQLSACAAGPFAPSRFSISHRGAPREFPEHTREGYLAAVTMGAGAIECDVTFTKDNQLVCRHSQCDLHSTTNILETPLASTCRQPFSPATADQPARAECCTSDITLAEFKSLCGRRDRIEPTARSLEQYLDQYAAPGTESEPTACGTLMSHADSIELLAPLDVLFIPELKAPMVSMPHRDMTQAAYMDALINAYRAQGIAPERVRIQSFNPDDLLYLVDRHPEFATNALWLDARGRNPAFAPTLADMRATKQAGINTLAPPMPMLLQVDQQGKLQATEYARLAAQAGLELVTWTFENGQPTDPRNWMYANVRDYLQHDSQMLEILHALHEEVGISGIFSDWPGTTTYYANCLGLE